MNVHRWGGTGAEGGDVLIGDLLTLEIPETYDMVWMSHVLEHQPNVNAVLGKGRRCLGPNRWLAVTVPPMKTGVVADT